jgi:hypothetical protein
MKEAAVTVGYIPKAFPRISETFVSNEIVELERLGLDLRIYTLVKGRDGEHQPSARGCVLQSIMCRSDCSLRCRS